MPLLSPTPPFRHSFARQPFLSPHSTSVRPRPCLTLRRTPRTRSRHLDSLAPHPPQHQIGMSSGTCPPSTGPPLSLVMFSCRRSGCVLAETG
jgi:hypothetical protein